MDADADRGFQHCMERIERLLEELNRHPDPKVRAYVQEISRGLLDLHSVAIERILEGVADLGEQGAALIDSLGNDDLVGNVLLLYGLHPVDLESRVEEALAGIRPLLQSHGSDVELLRIADNAVRLRLRGGCSTSALKNTVLDAIYDRAPDATDVQFDGEGIGNAHDQPLDGQSRIALPLVNGVALIH